MNMHRGSLVAGTMEMKRGSHTPKCYSVFSFMHHSSESNGSFIWRKNNMDFDLTDIYGVQSEGTVKNGNVGSHST